MAEIYSVKIINGNLELASASDALPYALLAPMFHPEKTPAGYFVACRMGDPDLLHCVVWREDGKPGGVFALHDKTGLLFAATASTGMAYAVALGYFGGLVANARYGVDVFENLEEPDD